MLLHKNDYLPPTSDLIRPHPCILTELQPRIPCSLILLPRLRPAFPADILSPRFLANLIRHFISLHAKLQTLSLRLPVPSGLNIPEWRSRLSGYHNSSLSDFLEYGWPIGYTSLATPASTHNNHGSAVAAPEVIQAYLDKEQNLGSLCRPFNANPLTKDLIIFSMQIVYSRSGKSRAVVDLSFPPGSSVNDGIPKDTYLDELLTLRLPGVDAFVDIIPALGAGCWLFKKDLSRAYRQLRIDPRDYHLLGLLHHNNLYFDIAPPFCLRIVE